MQVKIWPATACPFFWCPFYLFQLCEGPHRAKEGPLPTFFTCSSVFFTWKHRNEKLLSERNECQLMSPWEEGFCGVKCLNKPENKNLGQNRYRGYRCLVQTQKMNLYFPPSIRRWIYNWIITYIILSCYEKSLGMALLFWCEIKGKYILNTVTVTGLRLDFFFTMSRELKRRANTGGFPIFSSWASAKSSTAFVWLHFSLYDRMGVYLTISLVSLDVTMMVPCHFLIRPF